MKFLSNTHKGELYAALSGMMYGLVGYFGINIINASVSPSNMTFWRCLTSAFIAFIIFFIKNKPSKAIKSDIFKIFIYGMIFYGPCSIVYFYASNYIGTGIAMVIFFTYPVIVVMLNKILYKAHISRTYYFSIAIILIGIMLLADIDNTNFNIIGIMLGLLSAIGYGCYITACRNIINIDPILSTFIVSLGCTASGLVFAIIDKSFTIPSEINTWINIFGMALIATSLPILLLLESMRYISTTKASILSVLEPVFVVLFGVILLDERINTLQIIGIIIILLGAILTLRCK